MADRIKLSPLRRQIVAMLKSHEPMTVAELAELLERKHTGVSSALEHIEGVVQAGFVRGSKGRPAKLWTIEKGNH